MSADTAFRSATSGSGCEVPYRAEMERSFGESFGNVQAYSGRGNALSSMGAEAAASQEKVAFASLTPTRHLVAHELTHIVQERRAGTSYSAQRSASVAPVDSSAEREAESLAPRAAAGERVQVKAAPGGTYHRSRGSSGGLGALTATPGPSLAGAWEQKVRAQGIDGWGQFKSKLNLRQYQALNTPEFIEKVAEYVWFGYNSSDAAAKRTKADAVTAHMRSKADALHTDDSGAWFWSGVGSGNAAVMARDERGKTLEMTLGGSLFDGLAFGTGGYMDWVAKLGPLWDSLSNNVAQGCSGKVIAAQYIGIRQGSVFEREELPELEDLLTAGIVTEIEFRIYYKHPDGDVDGKKFHHSTTNVSAMKSSMWVYGRDPNDGYPPGVRTGTRW